MANQDKKLKEHEKNRISSVAQPANSKSKNGVAIFLVILIIAGVFFLNSKSEVKEKIVEEKFNPVSSSYNQKFNRDKEIKKQKIAEQKITMSEQEIKKLIEIVKIQQARLEAINTDKIKEAQKDENRKIASSMSVFKSTIKSTPSNNVVNNDSSLLNLLSSQAVNPNGATPKSSGLNLPEPSYLNVSRVQKIDHIDRTLTAGKFIKGILETAINSTLSGQLRAIVSTDIYSENGTNVLIPKGTRLIGEYQNGIAQGQTKIFVIWQTAITPNGYQVPLSSLGTDQLGVTGLSGDYDSHFFKRFGGALLLSIIENSSSGSNNDFSNGANNSLQDASAVALNSTINIPPTIYVDQGTVINIFVANNIQF